jgi:WD40 repeat protein
VASDTSSDGLCVVSGSFDDKIRTWDVATCSALGETLRGQDGKEYSVSFSENGKCIVSGDYDGTVLIWEVASGAALGDPMRRHCGRVWSAYVSVDLSRIVSCGDDCTVCECMRLGAAWRSGRECEDMSK